MKGTPMSADEIGGPEDEVERLRKTTTALGFSPDVAPEDLGISLAPTFRTRSARRVRITALFRRLTHRR